MFRDVGNGPTSRPDRTGGPQAPRFHGFGEGHANKSTKAIIGITILIVLSIVLYELRSSRDVQVSSASPAITQQIFASIS